MSRLFISNEWYDEVSPHSHYEVEFTAMIRQQIPGMFPSLQVCRFEPLLQSEYSTNKPDLAFVDIQYRKWWVVEVELSHHSLQGHVIPQVETFVAARYGRIEAQYICNELPSLNPDRVRTMIGSVEPTILVVAVGDVSSWRTDLRRSGVSLMNFSVYRSDRNEHIASVGGDLPIVDEGLIANCKFDKTFPQWLVLDSALPKTHYSTEEDIVLLIDGTETHWRLRTFKTNTLLQPLDSVDLPAARRFSIIATHDRRLAIERTM